MQPLKPGKLVNWIAAAICAGIWLYSRADANSLLRRATRHAASEGWISADTSYTGYLAYHHYAQAYFWDSDHSVVMLRRQSAGPIQIERLNLASGAREALEALAWQFDTNRNRMAHWASAPDGQSVLCVTATRSNVVYRLLGLDGAERASWLQSWRGNGWPAWFHDGRGFVEWVGRADRREPYVFRLGEPTPSLCDPQLLAEPPPLKPGAAVASVVLNVRGATPGTEFIEWSSRAGTDEFRRFRVPLPVQAEGADAGAVLSPKGDRLAWLVFVRQAVPRLALLRSYPFLLAEPRYRVLLGVSALDGSGFRELGRLRRPATMRTLVWSPDGKRVSFVFDDTLWSVPVDS